MKERLPLTTENEIPLWQEAIASLPEKQFFNTMRLYLGEIKTPYNKQKLTEELAAFIHKPENIQSIITLLDTSDIEILTAISIIPQVTQESLIDFFSGQYSVTELYAKLINLTERLLIYKVSDKYSEKHFYHINPFIKEKLLQCLDIKLLFPENTVALFSTDDLFALTPNLLAAFVSYIKICGISCKADGKIKKNDMNRLQEIFGQRENFFQLLTTAFINLSLIKETEKSYEIDKNRIELFAELKEIEQYALLTAASVSRFSKDGLRKQAQLLMDCLSSLPQKGFTRQLILRVAFLAGSYNQDSSTEKKSRFSKMLEAARFQTTEEPLQNASLLDQMIDSAIEFGLLQKIGKNQAGEEIYTANEILKNTDDFKVQNQKLLNIDSTFTVTILPGLPLCKLLPLTSFMMIKKFGVVTEFEITKKSVSAAFNLKWTPQNIFEAIENHTNYEIPQNLKINISEWYNAYTSATLYYGYILKVKDNNITLTENNPKIAKYIKEKLADGIYLLNIPSNSNITKFIDDSGLEFLGNIKTSDSYSEYTTFPVLRAGHQISVLKDLENKDPRKPSFEEARNLIESLNQALESRDLEKYQKESLKNRISGRLILSKEQLFKASIRTEILEADGMDFAGKIHLIDTAIKEEDLLEMKFPDAKTEGKFFTILGRPLGLSRQPGEAVLRFQSEPDKKIENFLVSRITHIRRLHF